MKRLLFLDDALIRHTNLEKQIKTIGIPITVFHFFNAENAAIATTEDVFDIISLDGDLGTSTRTGKERTSGDYLTKNYAFWKNTIKNIKCDIIIHSWNPDKSKLMTEDIEKQNINQSVIRAVFGNKLYWSILSNIAHS